MTAHAHLIVREWKKPELKWELHGWKADTSSAYIIDERGQPQVLELVLPPEFNGHDRRTPPFPQFPPAELAEIRLVPPPCRVDQAEAHALRVRASESTDGNGTVIPTSGWNPSRWELVRLSYDKEVLILRPEDDKALEELLTKFKEEKRREYAERKREIHDLSERLRHGQLSLGQERYYRHFAPSVTKVASVGAAQANLHFLNQERIKLEVDYTYPTGFLNWTLDETRQKPHIRDPYLQSKWATEHGLDLRAMAIQRRQVAIWSGLDDLLETRNKALNKLFGPQFEARQPSPVTLASSIADELKLGASIRFRVTFSNDGRDVWLTSFRLRRPEPYEVSEFGAARGKIVTLETIRDDHGKVLTKLDAVDKKTDQVLTGVQALTGLVGDQSDTIKQHHAEDIAAHKATQAGLQTLKDFAIKEDVDRNQWRENPLGCGKEAMADYLLAMDAVGIQGLRAVAIVRYGYGFTRKQCAEIAHVSVASIKRDLVRARDTHYKSFFGRTKKQRLNARQMLKKPDEILALLTRLGEIAPDKLRKVLEPVIAKRPRRDGRKAAKDSQWDNTIEGLT